MNKRIKKKLYKRFGRRTYHGYHTWWDKLSDSEKMIQLFNRVYPRVVSTYCHTIPLVKMLKKSYDFVGEQQSMEIKWTKQNYLN